jgi:hypothetical protein
MSKLRTPDLPSHFWKIKFQQKFSVDEFSYKICLNPSLYAKVMAVLPNSMFLQLPQPGSKSNMPPHA